MGIDWAALRARRAEIKAERRKAAKGERTRVVYGMGDWQPAVRRGHDLYPPGRIHPSLWLPVGHVDMGRSYRTLYGARMAARRMWGRS